MTPAPGDRHPLAAACDPRLGRDLVARIGPVIVLVVAAAIVLGVAFGLADIPEGGPVRAFFLTLLGAAGYFVRAMAEKAEG